MGNYGFYVLILKENKMDKTVELKPCPFCGGKAI